MAQATITKANEAARRYAGALFELAQDSGKLADINREFADFAGLARENADLHRLLKTPAVRREDKVAALAAIGDAAGLSPLMVRFLGTMAGNGRAHDIIGAQIAFDEIYARQRGVQRAVVTTAKPMTSAQRERLQVVLAAAVGGELELSETVNQHIVGGIQLRIGSRLIDASLASKLDRMNTAMKGA